MKIRYKENLSEHTNFKIGGPCDVFVEPQDEKELEKLVVGLNNEGIIYYVLGNGTNLLVSSKNLPGVVIYIGEEFSGIKVKGDKLECMAGTLLPEVCKEAQSLGLTGMEELYGIPGSVGGAVVMNAGAYGKEMSDIVHSVEVIDMEGKVKTLKKEALKFEYRKSIFEEEKYIITKVTLTLQDGDRNKIKNAMNEVIERRKKRQPLEYPSAGSIFKRPQNGIASQYIDKAMLKGKQIGGAQVSEKHCGFIVNINNAKSSDVYKLMMYVKSQVNMLYGVDLEPEIKLWGKF